jgi:asparagine synthase (glutamine-hydrolysing)
MCGIAGSLFAPNGFAWVDEQTKRMHLRGPDSQIVTEVNNSLCMGVARLAMTDPHPRSNQPMVDPETGNVISFNGEIYNFREIRRDLELRKVRFNTESDTEVLLKYLTIYMLENLENLNGMFAFAFFSKSHNKVYLSRDKLGKKPLYFENNNNGFRWSSSLDSFKERDKNSSISDLALIQYLSLGYLLDPTTTKNKIKSVMPGEILEINLDSRRIQKSSFLEKKLFTSEGSSSLRNLLGNSVSDRIEGHQKVAVSLSGGVDSSIIAIELAKKCCEVTAFTARWSDSDKQRYNFDADIARSTTSKLGIRIESIEMIRASEVEDELKKYLFALQEPNSNPSGVSMLRLYSEIAALNHRLLLTGDGSDEIFGGYARHLAATRIPNLLNLQSKNLDNCIYADSRKGNSILKKVMATQISVKSPLSWLNWHWIFTPLELSRILCPAMSMQWISDSMVSAVESIETLPKNLNSPQAIMLRDHQVWLSMESNRKLDRISMHYSIEARSPFQDDRIINWANAYMDSTKFKKLSKVALWENYPELKTLGVRRDKAGFTSPVGHWLRANSALVRSSIEVLSRDPRFIAKELHYLIGAPQRGNYREIMQLWSLVVLATWMQMEKR